ncbi:MAG: CHAT domain-containing tetratricopeptide repeat protein [Rhodothermales bacterium]
MSFLPAQAQPSCEALFGRAQQALESFQPRSADSAATATMRATLQRARACFAAHPALDSTAANHFAQTYGLDVRVLWETGRPDEAAALTEVFLGGPHLRADSAGVRYMLQWRGFLLDQRGDFEAGAQTWAQLLDYMPSASASKRTELWLTLASNYSWLGWWDDALAIYQSVQQELGGTPDLGPDLRAHLGRAFSNEAKLRLQQRHLPGNLARGLDAAREATRLLQLGESSREQHHRVFAYNTLSEAFLADGRLDSALVAARMATDLAGRLERPTPSAEIASWEAVGRVLLRQERYPEARAAFERALAISDETDVGGTRMAVLDGLTTTAMHAGNYERADSLSAQVLHLVEADRTVTGRGTGKSRANIWYPYYLSRVGLLLRQQRNEEAFLTLDNARARGLRDLRRRRFSELSPAVHPVADSLASVLADLHDQLAEPGLRQADIVRLRGRVSDVEAQKTALYGEAPISEHPSLAPIQSTLAEREQVLVTYYLGSPPHAFVLRPDTLLAVPLDPSLDADRIRSLMQAVSPQWNQAAGPIELANASFELAPLKTLYDLLFAPIAPHIPEGAALVVVPEGPLAQFPFGLLLERDPGRFQFSDAPFLLCRHPISTELAAALLLDEANPATASDLVAFGRSVFGGIDLESPLRSVYESAPPPDLPSVERELHHFGRRFPSALVALDGAATESSLYRSLGSARLLHLASHAFVAESDPLNSYIQLTADPDSTEDGRLYLYELLSRPLNASLVVLSGCRTARGRDLSGEGSLGLHYAVRAAGASSSLGTLWRVDDAATVELMDLFYDHLARGERKDVALQRAQIDYLDQHDGLRNSPFFWAAPVLYGNPAPIDLPSSPSSWWWLAGGGLLLLALLLPRLRRAASP